MKKSFGSTFFFAIGIFSLLLISCNQFGSEVKIKNNSVYYKNVSEGQARKLGDYLYNIGYFSDSNDISVQVSKPKDTIELRFVVDQKKVTADMDEQYLMIVSDLSDSVFDKAPIIVFLADTGMKDIKRVGVAKGGSAQTNDSDATNAEVEALLKSTEEAAAALGSNVKESKGNKLYFDNNVEADRVTALVSYLTEGGYFETNAGHIAVITKKGNAYIFKEAFTDEQINDKATTDALEDVATEIKQALFNKDQFSFEVCNLKFQPQLTFTPGSK